MTAIFLQSDRQSLLVMMVGVSFCSRWPPPRLTFHEARIPVAFCRAHGILAAGTARTCSITLSMLRASDGNSMPPLKPLSASGLVWALVSCGSGLLAACGGGADAPGPVQSAGTAGVAGSVAQDCRCMPAMAEVAAPSAVPLAAQGLLAAQVATLPVAARAPLGRRPLATVLLRRMVFSPVVKLSETGCVEPCKSHEAQRARRELRGQQPACGPILPTKRAHSCCRPAEKFTYAIAKPNAADCPNGTADDGRWDFPVGSVMIKTFAFDTKFGRNALVSCMSMPQTGSVTATSGNEAQTEATVVVVRRSSGHVQHRHAQRRLALPEPEGLHELPQRGRWLHARSRVPRK